MVSQSLMSRLKGRSFSDPSRNHLRRSRSEDHPERLLVSTRASSVPRTHAEEGVVPPARGMRKTTSLIAGHSSGTTTNCRSVLSVMQQLDGWCHRFLFDGIFFAHPVFLVPCFDLFISISRSCYFPSATQCISFLVFKGNSFPKITSPLSLRLIRFITRTAVTCLPV